MTKGHRKYVLRHGNASTTVSRWRRGARGHTLQGGQKISQQKQQQQCSLNVQKNDFSASNDVIETACSQEREGQEETFIISPNKSKVNIV